MQQVIDKCPDAISIFIIPPSFDELVRRIRSRRTEAEEIIQKRLNKASYEMQLLDIYSHVVVNDNVDKAAEKIKEILRGYLK